MILYSGITIDIPEGFISEIFLPFSTSRVEQLAAPGILLPGQAPLLVLLANLTNVPIKVHKSQKIAFLYFCKENILYGINRGENNLVQGDRCRSGGWERDVEICVRTCEEKSTILIALGPIQADRECACEAVAW